MHKNNRTARLGALGAPPMITDALIRTSCTRHPSRLGLTPLSHH
jgi:hypothetical protein